MVKIQENDVIKDTQSEVLTVASFYANPDLFLDYGDLIRSKYDFAEPTAKFLYDSLYEIYHYHTNGEEINEVKINMYMAADEERQKRYKALKGYSYIQRIIKLVDLNDFEKYYNRLKKFSLLRELDKKGFNVQKVLDHPKFDALTPEDVIDALEYQLNTVATVIGGAEDSIILGKEMTFIVQEWRKKPDIGIEIPFPIINKLIRGLRKKKLNLIGMHSGYGKSRTTSKIACYIGIKLGIPILIAANEQDENEWNAMVLSCVINNPEFGFDVDLARAGIDGIDETVIVTGAYEEGSKEEEIIMKAAQYIEENSRIHFLELKKYDENTLKRQIKRHKIKGCEIAIYDTLKSPDHDWISFVKTGDMLKEIAQELDISIWGTFQLTDDSLFSELLTSQAISTGKHIKHIADSLMMARPLLRDEYDKYNILIPDGFNGEEIIKPNPKEMYYIVFMDKVRGGRDKDKICLRVDKGKNKWIEEGYFILSEDEVEFKKIQKEHKRLKKEREVQKIKEELGKASEE